MEVLNDAMCEFSCNALAALQAAYVTGLNPGRCPGLLQFKPFRLKATHVFRPKVWKYNSPGQRPGLKPVTYAACRTTRALQENSHCVK